MDLLSDEDDGGAGRAGHFERVTALLGGAEVLRCQLRSPLEAHDMLLNGLPGAAVTHLVDRLAILRTSDWLEKAIGMSLPGLQPHRGALALSLNQEQSGRTWKFAEIFARATEVLGSQEEAEQWLLRPAIGLDQRRPIDLLATPAGVEIVEDALERMDYGVYA